jgi:hypothetical protein
MKKTKKQKDWIKYYEDRDILNEVTSDPSDLVLDEGLRREILSGKRKRNLKNITIKIDPLQVMAIKKLSTADTDHVGFKGTILRRFRLEEGIFETPLGNDER